MPLNELGELVKSWPGGFFEKAYRSSLTMLEEYAHPAGHLRSGPRTQPGLYRDVPAALEGTDRLQEALVRDLCDGGWSAYCLASAGACIDCAKKFSANCNKTACAVFPISGKRDGARIESGLVPGGTGCAAVEPARHHRRP